jgi:hypothetical protein
VTNKYVHIGIRKATKDRIVKEIIPIFKDRNPDLIHLPLTYDFIINWVFDDYSK